MNIRDRQLSTIYRQLEAQKGTIDDNVVVKLLAAVGDSTRTSFEKMLVEMAKPGMTRQQQLELAQKGLAKTELKDLEAILDNGTVPMSPSARAFLETLVGRAPNPGLSPLQIVLTGSQKNGLAGMAGPNVTIEAINLTTAPGGRLHNEDTMVIGKTDQYGKFSGALPEMQEGDVIRMRARDAQGNVGEWTTIKASGLAAADTRNAVVALFRVGLTDLGNGKIAVENINGSRQISEPGAKLQFTNVRTGEKRVVTIDDAGQMPRGLELDGKPGDAFSVAATDGKNNVDFKVEVGRVTVPGSSTGPVALVDIPDPALHKDELDANGKPRFIAKRFSGPLFKDGVRPEDAVQGQIGDCYFPAAMAALAKARPEVIQNMIKENGDGTYTVTFKEKDWRTNTFKSVEVKVDGDLYVRTWGGPLYGASAGDRSEKGMELWFPLVEKAYAQWKGSYDAIGNGGRSSDVWQACLGVDCTSRSVSTTGPDQLWSIVKDSIDTKKPVGAGTYGETEEARYTNSGVYANHAYSIIGYEEKDGVRCITLRNPWGESEPAGNGRNDGIFNLTMEQFQKLYSSIYMVR